MEGLATIANRDERVGIYSVRMNGEELNILGVKDFPPTDPWSIAMRGALTYYYENDVLDPNKPVTEFGAGDLRNLLLTAMYGRPGSMTAIDIDDWRLAAGEANMAFHAPHITGISYETTDVVYYLDGQYYRQGEKFNGNVIMCLPQSKPARENGGGSNADVFHETFETTNGRLNVHGLALIAVTLNNLHGTSGPDTKVAIILSNRIPLGVHAELFAQTGWDVVAGSEKTSRVKQDWDTSLEWMRDKSVETDGTCFYDKDGNPLTKEKAIARVERVRQAVKELDENTTEKNNDYVTARQRIIDDLNVYHVVTVYCLHKKK